MKSFIKICVSFLKRLAPTPLILKYPDLLDVWEPTVTENLLLNKKQHD